VSDDDVLKRLKKLSGALDAAKTAADETARQIERSTRVTERIQKDVRLLDTSHAKSRRRPGRKK
jgi:hypothetical protein